MPPAGYLSPAQAIGLGQVADEFSDAPRTSTAEFFAARAGLDSIVRAAEPRRTSTEHGIPSGDTTRARQPVARPKPAVFARLKKDKEQKHRGSGERGRRAASSAGAGSTRSGGSSRPERASEARRALESVAVAQAAAQPGEATMPRHDYSARTNGGAAATTDGDGGDNDDDDNDDDDDDDDGAFEARLAVASEPSSLSPQRCSLQGARAIRVFHSCVLRLALCRHLPRSTHPQEEAEAQPSLQALTYWRLQVRHPPWKLRDQTLARATRVWGWTTGL
eukprot:SAG11_NODE_1687_length_4448_cov_3.035640_1_plen_277_part_00